MSSTHDVTTDGSLVVKRYTSWDRDEHRREWEVLRRVHRMRPELVPRPVAADLDARPPWVSMTVVPGEPLGGSPTPAQLDALAVAITALWTVPAEDLVGVGPWRDDLGFARRLVDRERPAGGPTAAAYDAAIAWWQGPDPDLLRTAPKVTVLGHRDPNLTNYLWNGRRVRIVDLEDAAVSDAPTELAILVEHWSARRLDADRFRVNFDEDPVRLRAARRLWAMFWLWLLLPGGPSHHRNPPGTAEAQARRLLELLARDHPQWRST